MELFRRLWYLLNRRRIDAVLRAEMESHRAMMADPARFGNARRLREEAHDVWGFRPLEDLLRDLQLAARSLRRTPAYTVIAGGTLATAIAVAAVVAAVVNAYLLQPLPYTAADRLYHVMYAPPGPWEPAGLSSLDWQALDDVVEHAVMAASETLFVIGGGRAEPSRALRVNLGLIEGLGVRAWHGRALDAGDYAATGVAPAMISVRLWRERFGGDPSAVGRELVAELDSEGRTPAHFRVVGILPDGWWFGRDSRDLVDVLLPLDRPVRTYRVRLRHGVSAAHAAARLTEAVRHVATDLPPAWPGVTLESARERYTAPLRPVLRAVAIVTVVVLAIACANLAGLTLLRALRRQREIGIRLALGAGFARLARMLVVEAALLVVGSCAIGLWLGSAALDALGAGIATHLGRPAPAGPDALRLDAVVVAWIAGLAVLVSGALPLLALLAPWDRTSMAVLGRGGRTSTDTRAARLGRRVLVAAQIAGSLSLLVGAGLMLRSLVTMVRADYGIRTAGLVRVGVDFTGRPEGDGGDLGAQYDDLVRRVAALTGSPVPLFHWPQFAETPKQPVETDAGGIGAADIGVVPVNPAYFEVLGIALLRGRPFTDVDGPGSEPVALVSESAARRLWPGGDPIGRRLLLADRYIAGVRSRAWRTVVGVVADVRQTFDDRDAADVYTPFRQAPPSRYAWLYVASDRPAATWEPALRAAIAAIDARALVRVAVPLEAEAARQWAAPEMLTWLAAGLAAFALFFAVLGVYGVTAFSLRQRSREMAIRSALGATIGRLTRMVVRESGVVLGAGLLAGLVGALAVGRALRSQLHGVEPLDAVTFVAASAVLAAATAGAVAIPALRAARRSPVSELAEG